MTQNRAVVLQDGTNTYVYGLDLISATDASGNQTYFTYDGLGSTTDLTNGSGAVTGSYTYDVFGATLTGPAANQWQFTGEQKDADSGLYYLRARYYDPATGRFLGRDPLNIGNRYSYVDNNPVNWVDPTGLASEGPGTRAVPTPTPTPCPTPTPTSTPTPVPTPPVDCNDCVRPLTKGECVDFCKALCGAGCEFAAKNIGRCKNLPWILKQGCVRAVCAPLRYAGGCEVFCEGVCLANQL